MQGIQVSKILVDGSATCYVSALNRSRAQDASSIPDVAPADVSVTVDLVDITFFLPNQSNFRLI